VANRFLFAGLYSLVDQLVKTSSDAATRHCTVTLAGDQKAASHAADGSCGRPQERGQEKLQTFPVRPRGK
jgi:hypothetical protein